MTAVVDLGGREGATLAFGSLPQVGPDRLRWFCAQADPVEVWRRVVEGASLDVRGWTPELAATWRRAAEQLDPAALAARHREAGVAVLDPGSDPWPARLADDPRPPAVLCTRGSPPDGSLPSVGIVGTRRATAYGRRVAAELGGALASLGIVVVSGLAAGIDAEAHRAALARGGPVVGVVAGGLDHPYPSRNRGLWDDVARHGWLVAEAPLGVRPEAWRFPLRNRIIAALSDVVVVVESASAGGSMHTVREAERRDRTVLAVPGPITSAASAGTNDLLADGCAPCRSIDDVLTALDLASPGEASAHRRVSAGAGDAPPGLGPEARAVLEAVGWESVPLDVVVTSSGLTLVAALAAVEQLCDVGVLLNDGGVLERKAAP